MKKEHELELFDRACKSKGETKQQRRDGKIPVVICSKGKVTEHALIKKVDMETILREVPAGFLSTTFFNLKGTKGKRRVVIKDIQYHVTSYHMMHVDFFELQDTEVVEINIPIECLGTVDCIGVKGGGYLRQIMRYLKVRCLPRAIPNHFEVNVKDLDVRQARRVKDIKLPAGVTTLVKPQEVIATIVK